MSGERINAAASVTRTDGREALVSRNLRGGVNIVVLTRPPFKDRPSSKAVTPKPPQAR